MLTRDEAKARWKAVGANRARYEFCSTCVDTVNRHAEFEEDPLEAALRMPNRWQAEDKGARARAELRAVAMLIDAHRAEFTEAVESLLATASLSEARTDRAYRRRFPNREVPSA